MKKSLILISMAIALMSCSKVEQDTVLQTSEKQTLAIPVSGEHESMGADVKSYLSQPDESAWNIVWENTDRMGYFQFRGNRQVYHSFAPIYRFGDGTVVEYTSDEFKPGDVIYTYLDQGVENSDPVQFKALIPAVQMTNYGDEDMSRSIPHMFSVRKPEMASSYPSNGKTVEVNAALGFVAPAQPFGFKIKGYDPDSEYCCDGLTDVSIDCYGNVTGMIEFDAITRDDQKSVSRKGVYDEYLYEQTYDVSVYAAGHSSDAAQFTIKASTVYYSGNIIHAISELSVKYSCEITKAESSFVTVDSIIETDKAFPIQDCMPCVSQGFALSSYLIKNPEDIQSNITMYMLGSVVEFRVYSTDGDIAAGEDLIGVQFTADKGCAGIGTCDLTAGDMALSNMSEKVISAYDNHEADQPLVIRNSKEDYVSLYMVIAPGTYNASVTFLTTDKAYTLKNAQKTFNRAVKTNMSCNLANAVMIQPVEEFLAKQ